MKMAEAVYVRIARNRSQSVRSRLLPDIHRFELQ